MSRFASPEVPRRVVTAVRDGRSVIAEDGPAPNAHHYRAVPGMMTSVLYATPTLPSLGEDGAETAPPGLRIPPGAGETRLMIVSFPPDSTLTGPQFDADAAYREQRQFIPGLAELFEATEPGMHRTETLDYDIVLEGEIWLELDDGVTTHLRAGDVVVQRGTRHAWRNRGDRAATMCFVLIGARAGPPGEDRKPGRGRACDALDVLDAGGGARAATLPPEPTIPPRLDRKDPT